MADRTLTRGTTSRTIDLSVLRDARTQLEAAARRLKKIEQGTTDTAREQYDAAAQMGEALALIRAALARIE